MKRRIKKPQGTFYSDYAIQDGKCFAIFEHDVRKTTIFVCNTKKQNSDWRTFNISETKTHLIIDLNESK